MTAPLISIVLPAYNSSETLGRAIESVVQQTTGDWELIVVDDGSTDATPEITAHYRQQIGERLTALRQANGGPSAARNAGIDRARGRYVCFLDADDEFLPTKLARQMGFFERCPELGLVFSDYAYVDLRGRYHPSVFDDLAPFVRRIPFSEPSAGLRVCGAELVEAMTGRYTVSTITGMVRRDVLDAGVRFPDGLMYCEEWLFFLEVARRVRGGYVNEALSLHHHTAGSVSRSSVRRNLEHRVRALGHVLTHQAQDCPAARRALRRQLHESCRQLGYDCYKAGEYAAAQRHFQSALRHGADVRGVVHLLQALMRRCAGC